MTVIGLLKRTLVLGAAVIAGVILVLSSLAYSVRFHDLRQPVPWLQFDVAILGCVVVTSLAFVFKASRRRPLFWAALLIPVAAQAVLVLAYFPPTLHIRAIWAGLIIFSEFTIFSNVLVRLGFRQ